MTEHQRGQVITFYSYKGGTGRTMALANIAWLLAANGKRVLVVDWDLESPGLHRFFHTFITPTELQTADGVVDLLASFMRSSAATETDNRPEDWFVELARVRPYAFTLNWPHFQSPGRIDFMSAGQQDDTYGPSLAQLDWDVFYSAGGMKFLRALREDMGRQYDYALIDSRTGVSDVADVCTQHLPDTLVACFTLGEQGISGAAERVGAISKAPRPVRIFPVPMRVDDAEKERANAGRTLAMQRFAELPTGLSETERVRYWRSVEVPYHPFYVYEEVLAMLAELPGQQSSPAASYERLAAYLTDGDVDHLPPIDESLRLSTMARSLRSAARPVDPVVLRYEAVDQVWAEWIADVLKGVEVDVYDGRETASPAVAGARQLVVISPDALTLAEGYLAEHTATRPPIGVYVGDADPVPAFPLRSSAQLSGQTETVAIEKLLQAVGYEGSVRPATRFRYPGRPAGVFNVPAQNPNFTGREDDLRALRKLLLENRRAALLQSGPVALHGWGGIGKTQVAMEYAYRFRSAYDAIWWIVCDPAVFIDSALADLAKELGLTPAASVPETIRAVLNALSRGEPYSRWLLIFDNALDFDQLRPFLPRGSGEVLITSRAESWPGEVESIAVDVFKRGESIVHLQRRIGGDLSVADAARVANALGDLPIAVAAAGAYLRATGVGVAEYLQQIEELGPKALPDKVDEQLIPPVEATWDLLLERLQLESKAASRLLQLCSVMASEVALPLIYSDQMAAMLRPYDPAIAERHLRGSLVQIMNRLALIKLDQTSGQLSVHRLLQHVIRQRMSDRELTKARHEVHLVLSALRSGLDVDDPESWTSFRMLWPHLEVSQAAVCPDEAVRALMIDRLRYVWLRGNLAQGELLGRSIVAGWNDLLQTLESDADRLVLRRQILHLQFNLANILRDQARFTEARRLDQQTLAAQKKLQGVGPKHPHTLMTANGLAADLRALGQYRESLELDQATYVAWVDGFGEDHPRTLLALNNLAATYRLLGDYRAARRHDTTVYERQRAIPGNERNPITLRAATNLGRDLREAGEYQASVRLLRGIVEEYGQAFGAESRFVLNATTNLAVSLRSAGQADEAVSLLESAYERFTESVGPDSPETLACRLSWSLSLLSIGDTAGARNELEAVSRAYERGLGAKHPHTLVCVLNQSMIARADHDDARARALATIASTEIRDVLGPLHPYTLAAAMNLAVVTAESGDLQPAATQMAEITEQLEKVLLPDHPDTVRGHANLALARRLRGGPVAGEAEITERLVARLGSDHPAVEAFREHRYLHRVIDPHPF